MKIEHLREEIESLASHILFEYKGMPCGIDPISMEHIDIWCGEDAVTATSVDEAMSYFLFNGKCLNDIAAEIQRI